MARSGKMTEEKLKTLIKMRKNRVPIQQIANEIGLCFATTTYWIDKMRKKGLDLPKIPKTRLDINDKLMKELEKI